jgi:hypothetical protein
MVDKVALGQQQVWQVPHQTIRKVLKEDYSEVAIKNAANSRIYFFIAIKELSWHIMLKRIDFFSHKSTMTVINTNVKTS